MSNNALKAIGAVCFTVGVVAFFTALTIGDMLEPKTIVVGIGCGTEMVTMVADHESDLPTCERVEVHFLPGRGR